jgi:hypothetical protein
MAGSIVVRTQNPRDITLVEAREIAATIRGLNLDSEVRVEEQEREGRGVTWFEISTSRCPSRLGRFLSTKRPKKSPALLWIGLANGSGAGGAGPSGQYISKSMRETIWATQS